MAEDKTSARVASAPSAFKPPADLVVRLVSAAVLIPFALAIVWQGGVVLAVGAAGFAAIMGYEYASMGRFGPRWLLLGCAALGSLWAPFLGVLAGIGVLSAGAAVVALVAQRDRLMAGFGVLYAGGMPLGLLALREGTWDGQSAALILMGIVWASDSAAYFAGRGFGGPALSSDSPNKTWSGALGAFFCCMLCGMIAAGLLNASYVTWIIVGAMVSVISQAGDLFESSLKRRFGVKDASDLVPGHGGVMDRVDGLGAVCVIGALILAASPGLVSLLGL